MATRRKTKRKSLGNPPADHKYQAGVAKRRAVKKLRELTRLSRAGDCSHALDQLQFLWREYEGMLIHNIGHVRGGDAYANGGHKLGTLASKATGVFSKFCLKK